MGSRSVPVERRARSLLADREQVVEVGHPEHLLERLRISGEGCALPLTIRER